ncbi:MAG: hemerythrin family protein [Geobacteraceae bacterium]|nr:hemerythrin family protein [Geobacteraceae bacterium]
MSFMIWNDAFDLGIKEFDEHHKHLVALINLTYDIFTQGTTHDGIVKVLDELVDYTKYHFAAEEHWMAVNKYPNLSQHSDEHESFCQTVSAFQSDFFKRKTNLSLEVLQFLNDWLTAHILKSDADYSRFAALSSPTVLESK